METPSIEPAPLPARRKRGRPGPPAQLIATPDQITRLEELRRSGLPRVAQRAAGILHCAEGWTLSEASAAVGMSLDSLWLARKNYARDGESALSGAWETKRQRSLGVTAAP